MSHIKLSHVTHERVMSHIWMSHVTRMNDSYQAYEWVMSHVWMSLIARIHTPCHTHERVMSHTLMSHATHVTWRNYAIHENLQYMYVYMYTFIRIFSYIFWRNGDIGLFYGDSGLFYGDIGLFYIFSYIFWRHTWESVMSHSWKNRVTHRNRVVTNKNASCHTFDWVVSHIRMSLVTLKSHVIHKAFLRIFKALLWCMGLFCGYIGLFWPPSPTVKIKGKRLVKICVCCRVCCRVSARRML